MGSTASTLSTDILKNLMKNMSSDMKDALALEIIKKCADILKENPGNRCCKYTIEYLSSDAGKALSNEDAQIFFKCICTGLENPKSGLGCYAMTSTDYTKFGSFFDKVICDYHDNLDGAKTHVTEWNTPEDSCYDVKVLGLDELSMRVRVGRNIEGFNLPGAMDKNERVRFERSLLPAFEKLIGKWGGKVFSLTPAFDDNTPNPNLISDDEYNKLVDAHVMFKNMDADSYLKSAGISNDWPYGRGCWQSEDKMRIIWFGEEDQLRIMCMKKSTNILEIFTNLKDMLDEVENMEGIKFAKDDKYGFVTSCPSNLGTGMRASVHIKIPNITKDGTDSKAKEICKPLGLSVRGIGGEHTPIGADGTVDISPSSRLFVKECDIIAKLYEGVKKLMTIEKELELNTNLKEDSCAVENVGSKETIISTVQVGAETSSKEKYVNNETELEKSNDLIEVTKDQGQKKCDKTERTEEKVTDIEVDEVMKLEKNDIGDNQEVTSTAVDSKIECSMSSDGKDEKQKSDDTDVVNSTSSGTTSPLANSTLEASNIKREHQKSESIGISSIEKSCSPPTATESPREGIAPKEAVEENEATK